VCPGVGIGLKFILNSPAKVFNNSLQITTTLGFATQKNPGISKRLIKALNQFNLKPSHRTVGSKIENKFPIYFKK
jgi:hypothetical protein